MSDKFHTEMEVTKGKVLEMGYLAVGMLDDALVALEENDPQRAEGVKARKRSYPTGRMHLKKRCTI